MKKLLQYTLLAILAFGFIGCGGYAINYNTNPIGANIVCGGAGKGLSPLTLYYDKDGIDDNGFLHTVPCKAIFVSGYEADFSSKWDTNEFPDGVQQTITRPKGKGYKQDIAFGMEHQRTLIMQQQAAAAAASAWAAQQQMQNQQYQYQNQQRRTTICNKFGNITMCN